jgi:hypothetical protein
VTVRGCSRSSAVATAPAGWNPQTKAKFFVFDTGVTVLRFKRFGVAVAVAGLSGVGLILAGTAPAFAAPSLTCTGGSGTATLSPGITNTPTQQTISGTDTLTGCSGPATSITGGTVTTSGLKTVATGNPPMQASCSGLGTVQPKGTLEADISGVVSITWSDGSTSAGVIKLKSAGVLAQEIVVIKITSGTFFVSGHTTKLKGTITFAPSAGQTCPTLTQVDVTNSSSSINTI